MTTATLIKNNIKLGLAYSSGVQSILTMQEHGGVQADTVLLEKELRVLSNICFMYARTQ